MRGGRREAVVSVPEVTLILRQQFLQKAVVPVVPPQVDRGLPQQELMLVMAAMAAVKVLGTAPEQELVAGLEGIPVTAATEKIIMLRRVMLAQVAGRGLALAAAICLPLEQVAVAALGY